MAYSRHLSIAAIAGLVAIAVVARSARFASPEHSAVHDTNGAGADPRPQVEQVPENNDLRVRAVEQRLLQLEARVQSTGQYAAPPTRPKSPREPPSPEQQLSRDRTIHDRWVNRFTREGVDPKWAKETSEALASDLRAAGQGSSFSVERVDCRTTMCSAMLEWPSYGAVPTSARRIMDASYEVGCAKHLFVPPPDNGASSEYRAELYFDCEIARAGP
jgi:hypothetical protein